MYVLMNIKEGEPKTPEQVELSQKIKARFFFDEKGRDWYESQQFFAKDTLKIAFDKDGIIRCIETDVSVIYPENLSVAEVLNTAENRRADTSGEWIYSDGTIRMREKTEDELTRLAEQKKNELITKAKDIIAPLQDAMDLGIATTDEESRLLAWKKYRVSLSRIDTTNHAGINWPKEPDNNL